MADQGFRPRAVCAEGHDCRCRDPCAGRAAAKSATYHAHILLTMRKLGGEEFAKTKCHAWNSKEQLNEWREQWAEKGARALSGAGYAVEAERWRHGHKTLEQQHATALSRGDREFAERLEGREATIHKGPKITAMERRGEPSERMDRLKEIVARNEIRVEIRNIDREVSQLRQMAAREAEAPRQERIQGSLTPILRAPAPDDTARQAFKGREQCSAGLARGAEPAAVSCANSARRSAVWREYSRACLAARRATRMPS
jgi:hypothetical protein